MMIKKCLYCNKKANTLGLICKCGGLFRMEHRLPETHKCPYDYRNICQKQLTAALIACSVVDNRGLNRL